MTTTEPKHSGLDLTWVDPDVRPQDDLFAHVNGRWLATHEIPEDRSQDGAFRVLRDRAEEHVRVIVEECAAGSPEPGTEARKVGDLYSSFMDTERVEQLGVAPLRPLLDEIYAAGDRAALAGVLGRRQREGRAALFGEFIATDAKDSSRYLVNLNQSGLGLPDEAYYREDDSAEIRAKYVEHLQRLAELVGLAEPARVAEQVMELETALAAASWDRVTNRDAEKTYTLLTREQLRESAPGFDWAEWEAALGVPAHSYDEVIVRQPSFVTEAGALWAGRPLEQWQAWLALHTAAAATEYLSSDLVEEDFDFYGRTLSGTPELRERWKRGVSLVEGALGEAVGKLYVERHFPPKAKERINELVANIVEAYRQSISTLDWMSPETRERALEKLGKFTPKVGYPERWKDYSDLGIDPADLLGNVGRAAEWRHDFEYAKLGGPVDRYEWLMTPQTVNAYYHPRLNEIAFPAAILQPPFFDADADDAANYGGIGAVIGHEIGHGFDDQGSRYDGDGNLQDWWETADREEFDTRSRMLIDQYSALSPMGLPEHKVNGALTVGENIGDLGGLTIALKAYAIANDGTEPPTLDGLTGEQRVLFGWAQVWRAVTRDAEAIRRLATDPHSPPDLRCNAVVTNLDTFHEAFGVTETDELFTEPGRRVRIW
ncbi:Metallopeptidase [Pseudonocardia sp. Ae168_Ps1]|uniref:M13 family metallopeptidase n=1 Tax=unclassified Pseudonocardia TaxID=2619320 RepID=UPI00094ABDC6|nr:MULTISPECIES: M13-type metalloendopeptidase [unclassified Pseudonocardia]OLL71341.1 Metallopeptidase [Pseudonocardia sp. Ae168_Ps1]OLL77108.1 Metallopeptidase [Pseudonocardia sp. Ae150A_Ps1]OLL88784.1 Metallopeptidase [Pseudonocardia sp. Ae263_Ps1]OLL91196.1 Metallopeptidase [Pseudonocardia sp. Ae356_Ps1]